MKYNPTLGSVSAAEIMWNEINKTMDLDTLQKEVGQWSDENFGKDDPPYRKLLGVIEELGELAHAHLKCEQGIRGDEADHFCAKCDAIGDTIIYLADYCHKSKINLHLSVITAWHTVKQRNWKKNKENGQ